jgi:CBS-domain-containing membrane protein
MSLFIFMVINDMGTFIHESPHVVFGAMAVGLAIFVMVITGTAHPPAAGLALELILNEWSPLTIVVVLPGLFHCRL